MAWNWRCEVCGNVRPDHLISVYKLDLSLEFGLAVGQIVENVKYCNDKQRCSKAAPLGIAANRKQRDETDGRI